jgi:hypothetical protein
VAFSLPFINQESIDGLSGYSCESHGQPEKYEARSFYVTLVKDIVFVQSFSPELRLGPAHTADAWPGCWFHGVGLRRRGRAEPVFIASITFKEKVFCHETGKRGYELTQKH